MSKVGPRVCKSRSPMALLSHLQVFRLPVQECLSYLTCAQCRDSQDPYCGWCVVEGR